MAFREARIPSGLIPWADVGRWIATHAASDGERAIDLRVTLPTGTTVDRRSDGSMQVTPPLDRIRGRIHFLTRTIPFSLPGDTGVRRMALTGGGVLDQLDTLATDIAETYAWQPAQAVVFILAGISPYVAPVRVTISHHSGVDVFGSTGRIQLDIDPAASPVEVLQALEEARADDGAPRRRTLSVKHLRLAAFAKAEHTDKSWAERHRLWNAEFPDWAISNESNFRRDASGAAARVLQL